MAKPIRPIKSKPVKLIETEIFQNLFVKVVKDGPYIMLYSGFWGAGHIKWKLEKMSRIDKR